MIKAHFVVLLIYTKQPVLLLLMLSSFIFWVSLKEITSIYKAWTQISQFLMLCVPLTAASTLLTLSG